MKTELIFVYNAKSNRLNVLLDVAHKIVSPSTYDCDLCKLTHSNFGERKTWKAFTETSKIPLIFYHIDEFEELYSESYSYPIILKKEGTQLFILLDAEGISQCETTEKLITGIKKRL